MTRPEINLWGEFIFKTKWDADSRRETQIFFFFINVQIRIGVNYVYYSNEEYFAASGSSLDSAGSRWSKPKRSKMSGYRSMIC